MIFIKFVRTTCSIDSLYFLDILVVEDSDADEYLTRNRPIGMYIRMYFMPNVHQR